MILTVLLFLARPWIPPVASQHGNGIDFLINYLLLTSGVIFIAGHLILSAFVWKYSRRGAPPYRPLSSRTEWAWVLLPVLLMTAISEAGVLVLGLPIWEELYGKEPKDCITVEAVGKQFEWITRYPGKDGKFGKVRPDLVHDIENPLGLDKDDPAAKDDIVLRGPLHLPEGKLAQVQLRSHDVIHSYTVPQFRIKQDLLPGFTTSARFRPVRAGKYEVACAELCGLGHYRMRNEILVEPEKDFQAWLSQQKGWFE
ncbi:MAG: cytochrome c oxidase subunit II [Planctomycetes bacterium]|nr:cytochrome c oxidase subunit II [Planctomycetota bacterium]